MLSSLGLAGLQALRRSILPAAASASLSPACAMTAGSMQHLRRPFSATAGAGAVRESGPGKEGPLPTEEDRSREFREVVSRKNDIRMSPWKINLLARQIRELPVVEALLQLKLSRKMKGPPLVGKVIQNAANLASIRYDLNPEDLYVAEAFVNRGHVQKGILIHGRGRFGVRRRAYSHVVVKLREIDFEARIRQATNRFQKARWLQRQKVAEEVRHARDQRNSPTAASAQQ